MSKIPGFRSGKAWKKIIATVGYLFIALVVIGIVNDKGSKPTAIPTTNQTPSITTSTSTFVKTPEQLAKEKADAGAAAKQKADAEAVQAAKAQAESIPATNVSTPISTPPATAVSTSTPVPAVSTTAVDTSKQDTTVYITETGKKYHNDGCRTLSKGKAAISLADAKAKGYTPCSICNPPH